MKMSEFRTDIKKLLESVDALEARARRNESNLSLELSGDGSGSVRETLSKNTRDLQHIEHAVKRILDIAEHI